MSPLLWALLLACGAQAPVQVQSDPQPIQAIERFATIDCSPSSSDPQRAWCPVVAAGNGGRFSPPADLLIRVGISVPLDPHADLTTTLLEETSIRALFVGPAGAKAIDLPAQSDEDRLGIMSLMMGVAVSLKGINKPGAPIVGPKPLIEELHHRAIDLHPLRYDTQGATFIQSGTAVLRKVQGTPWGAVWVLIESGPSQDRVSIFPDRTVIGE